MIHNKNNTPFINQDTYKVEFAAKKKPTKIKIKRKYTDKIRIHLRIAFQFTAL